jgi:hypothetical protein
MRGSIFIILRLPSVCKNRPSEGIPRAYHLFTGTKLGEIFGGIGSGGGV